MKPQKAGFGSMRNTMKLHANAYTASYNDKAHGLLCYPALQDIGSGAERNANTDLGFAQSHRVRRHSKDSHSHQKQCQDRKVESSRVRNFR